MQIPHGAVVRWVCSTLCMDEQLVPEATVEEGSGTCADECILAARKCGWVVSAMD